MHRDACAAPSTSARSRPDHYNFRRRVWEPATVEIGMTGFRFHDLRHTAATLADASGTSLKALMARIGHSSADAALRYQHVIDGQDAEIVQYLERFGEEPPVPSSCPGRHDRARPRWARNGYAQRPDEGPVPTGSPSAIKSFTRPSQTRSSSASATRTESCRTSNGGS